MDRAFESGAVALAPTAPVTPSIGYPTGGNPVGGIPPTKPGDYWFHMVTEELRAIVAAAGLTPDRLVLNQVLQALPLALASRPEMARSLAANGYHRFPGGLILQWGNLTSSASADSGATFPIAFPSNCFCRVATVRQGTGAVNALACIGAHNNSSMNLSAFTANTAARVSLVIDWFALGN